MLFPELESDLERIVVRWALVAVGLTSDGQVTVAEVLAKTLGGTTVLSRTFWPAGAGTGHPDPLTACLHFAEELTARSG